MIRLDDLEQRWKLESPFCPDCAGCGKKLDGVREEKPVRLLRRCEHLGKIIPGPLKEIALCPRCYVQRLEPVPMPGDWKSFGERLNPLLSALLFNAGESDPVVSELRQRQHELSELLSAK